MGRCCGPSLCDTSLSLGELLGCARPAVVSRFCCGLRPKPLDRSQRLSLQSSIIEGIPDPETLIVPSFGTPDARKLETLDVSTLRPPSILLLNREEPRTLTQNLHQVSGSLKLENLKHCMFQLSGLSAASLTDKTACFVVQTPRQKSRLLKKSEFHDFTMFCLYPPKTEIPILGFSFRRAKVICSVF